MRFSTGFTMVELAIVFVIIGLITTMGMVATLGAVESARRASTENRLDAIEKALMDFRNKHNRLPCPSDHTGVSTDSSFGQELRDGTQCSLSHPGTAPYLFTDLADGSTVAEGGVPTEALGLPDEFMSDGWGRRFMYSIPTTAGEDNSFRLFIRPQSNQCSGEVLDQASAVRSNGPIYVLTSFGPNGHGGYLNDSTRVNAGITNPLELINCRCDSSAVSNSNYVDGTVNLQWVQADAVDSSNVATQFDDVVRYKERWQMMNADDYLNSANYKDYVMAVAYEEEPDLYFYQFNGCTREWVVHPDVAGSGGFLTPTGATNGENVIFDRDTVLFHTNSATRPMQPYYITRDNIIASTCAAMADCVPAVPAAVVGSNPANINPMVTSKNHYIALSYEDAPYVQLYNAHNTDTESPVFVPIATSLPATKLSAYPASGTAYGQITTVFPNSPVGTAPTAAPTIIAFSKNAEYMFLSDRTTYKDMYARINDNTYKKVLSTFQPASALTVNDIGSAAFSPDGKYFAIGIASGVGVSAVTIWKIRPGTPFTNVTNPFVSVTFPSISFPGNVPPTVAFSPDGLYLVAAGGDGSTGPAGTSGNVMIYKIDANDTFTDITANIEGSFVADEDVIANRPILFTPDSNQFFIAMDHTGGSTVVQFEKTTSLTWRLNTPGENVFSTSDSVTSMAITPP